MTVFQAWSALGTCVFFVLLLSCIADSAHAAETTDPSLRWKLEDGRWSEERANAWYARQGWLAGADFVPSTASNQLEMWQASTFDPDTIDRELGWAEGVGFNVMRVFLHDMAWKADPSGFEQRVDRYLSIAHKHGIKTLFVLCDSCWDPRPKLGPQEEPVPGLHNSRWVQSRRHRRRLSHRAPAAFLPERPRRHPPKRTFGPFR